MGVNPRAKILVFLLVIVIIALGALITDFYVNWMWFKSINLQSVFLTMLLSKVLLRIVVGLGFFLIFLINFLVTRRTLIDLVQNPQDIKVIRLQKPFWETFLEGRGLILFFIGLSFLLAYIFSAVASDNWMIVQQYLHAGSFGVIDPIYKQDVGFYVFKLPFYQLIYNYLMAGIIVSAILTFLIYLISSPKTFYKPLGAFTRPKVHISVLIALFFIIKAWGYKLSTYGLLYSANDVLFGAGYTDIHARLLAYQTLFIVALICSAVILVNLFVRRLQWVGISIALLVSTSLVFGLFYPAFIQKFRVLPNQFVMEEPYIAYNIAYTQKAYGLDNLKRQNFPAENTLTTADIKDNSDTIKNIRLWDWKPLQQTYSQLQEMRPYYTFKDIDIDRYVINGEYRQMMLGVRELVQAKLPPQAQTWINQTLKYTHGYGIAMNPVNEISNEGLPVFHLQNIPPETSVENLHLTRPEIYYGEETNNYVIVNTEALEFDYPMGDQNVESTYQGVSGVQLSSLFRRVMFATAFGDYKLLLSKDLTENSQILYNRNIHERIRKAVPFLHYDYDPYPVISNGKIYWIQDAYTTSNWYPYSEPTEGWGNYVRNSVKVVIDAYDGSMNFYVSDSQDPIIQCYQLIFPQLFKSIETMPLDLRLHLRYPEDLFLVQAKLYTTYHMQNTRIFYNKEDKWSLPEEIYGGQKETIKPYYTIMRLPGEEQPEFLLMIPFTPDKRTNMVAWMAARSDGEHYGQLLVYNFPKQKLIYGPMQIESRIDQDGEISKELTLWNQRGSNIFRGNLLVIPVEESLIYVEPLYLQAEQSRMPELRRVIVVYGDRVVMERNLEEALKKAFRPGAAPPPEVEVPNSNFGGSTELTINELSLRSYQTFQEAQRLLREGDWAGYGESMKELEAILLELQKAAGYPEGYTAQNTTTPILPTNPTPLEVLTAPAEEAVQEEVEQ
ncbi:MAG: UPF0182 family protein [Syntrophomonadaceae bacterium]|nr:UPF0182 family protein [Syntrophomonadaceae bacterium]